MVSYVYKSTKTYEHSVGLSACFRQWRAQSHCRFLHGYALQVRMVFEAYSLDSNNWVVDFGGLKPIKEWLGQAFDHKTLVAHDDPCLPTLKKLADQGSVDLIVVERCGCEAFAKLIYDYVDNWLIREYNRGDHASIIRSVEVREHGGNSAIYERVD